MALLSILHTAASYRTGGVRSFSTADNYSVWAKYVYNTLDQAYAKLWFYSVGGLHPLYYTSAAMLAAG